MQWTIFATVYSVIGAPLIAGMDALAAACQAWIAPNLRNGLLLYGIGRLLWAALKRDRGPLIEWESQIILGTIALYVASEGIGYTTFVRTVVLDGFGRGLSGAIAGNGRVPLSAAVFDEIWGRAWVTGVAVYAQSPWALVPLVIVYWIIAFAAVFFAFILWMTADVFQAFMLGVGPLFVGLFAFPWTKRLFWGWLGVLLASTLLKLLLIALLSVVFAAATTLLRTLAGLYAAGGPRNELRQVQQLFAGLALFSLCGWYAYQLRGIAQSIAGGFVGNDIQPVDRPDSPPSPSSNTGGNTGGSNGGQNPPAPSAPPPAVGGGSGIPRHQPPGRSLSWP